MPQTTDKYPVLMVQRMANVINSEVLALPATTICHHVPLPLPLLLRTPWLQVGPPSILSQPAVASVQPRFGFFSWYLAIPNFRMPPCLPGAC